MKFWRLTIGFLFVLCLTSNGMAQTVTFKKRIYSRGGNIGESVWVMPDGYLMVGLGNAGSSLSSYYVVKLFKFDSLGNLLVSKEYGMDQRNYYVGGQGSIVPTSDGNYLVSGAVQIAGIRQPMTMLFDNNLDTSWLHIDYNTIGGSNYFKITPILNNRIGAIGTISVTGKGTQFLLTLLDSIGRSVLNKVDIGLMYDEFGHSIGVTPNGSLILVGDKYRSASANSRIGYIVKTDALGNMVWDTTIGAMANNGPTYMTQLTDTSYLLFGSMDTLNSDYTPYISKLDTNGRPQWLSLIASEGDDPFIWQARQLSDGNILLGGEVYLDIEGDIIDAIWLMKIDPSGQKIWERIHTYYDDIDLMYQDMWLRDFQETSDKGFIITGVADALDTSGLIRQKFLLMKLDSLGCLEGDCGLLTDIPETQKQPVELSVFPNPAKEAFTIKYALPYGLHNNPQVVLYNLQGQQVYQALLYKAQDMLKVPTADLGSGMYIYQLVSGGKVLGSGKVVVE